MNLDAQLFHEKLNGKFTSLHFLQNGSIQMAVTTYGARIVSLLAPDYKQQPVDVVVGFDSLKKYLDSTEPYHGTIVGRFANRISRGKFTLNGTQYTLNINNPPNHLHGGPKGFHNQVWDVVKSGKNFITLSYLSKDGEENYPGNLQVQLTYEISEKNEVILKYNAQTDKPTIINLTSHPFFNLNGQGKGKITDHKLQIQASQFNPIDKNLIPTGFAPVENTPFDFRNSRPMGTMIDQPNDQLLFGGGYDHNYVLEGTGWKTAAKVTGNISGITMEVSTDQPGIQLYTGNFMKGENTIKYGLRDEFRSAFCLETQHFPDSPNHPEFPSTILLPGKLYQTQTSYRFSCERN